MAHNISKQARKYIAKEIKTYHATVKEIQNLEDALKTDKDLSNLNDAVFLRHKVLEHMKNFTEAFDIVYEHLPDEKRRLIQLMYWTDRFVNADGVGFEMGIDGSTVGRWRNSILNEIARRMGLK